GWLDYVRPVGEQIVPGSGIECDCPGGTSENEACCGSSDRLSAFHAILSSRPREIPMRAVATILWLLLAGASASGQELSAYAGAAIGALDNDNPGGGAFSDTVSMWKLYGGLQIGSHFGLEVSHGSTGAIHGEPSGSPLAVDVL